MNNEAVELLSRYIRINTSNPPGDETEAIRFFADIFAEEGIEYKTYESETGRISIRAELKGCGDKGPVILLNHMDVVPADSQQWSFDPFGGEVKNGFVHGRGALDMKGQGIMELLAFLDVKRTAQPLLRDLVFLAVADEECGGEKGMGYLMEHYPDDFQADLVINEGGFGVVDLIPGRQAMLISTAEKGACWLKLTRDGIPGHGSSPHGHNALEMMNKALARVFEQGTPIEISPVIRDYFKALAEHWDYFRPFLNDGDPETLIDLLEQSGLIAVPQINAMLRNTISLNMLHSGDKVNVIPGKVEAALDIRLLPGQSADDITVYIKEILDDDEISIEYIQKNESTDSPVETGYFELMKKIVLRHTPDAVVAPSLLVGSSDSRFFRDKGIVTYGFFPAYFPMDDFTMIHGIDEKISVENLLTGTELMTELVQKLCAR